MISFRPRRTMHFLMFLVFIPGMAYERLYANVGSYSQKTQFMIDVRYLYASLFSWTK